ncbi:MFS transporter [Sphingomonas sp. TX0543]|uniref:MFS transporter n=1 Tax=unclassified Sphingomonas TaxID=196159 RepID=UPI0010F652FE|nr:MFS transporter [Sphingomonas sp. 3P27F8]
MERDQLETAAHRGEWRGGWRIVLAAMIGIGFGPGLMQNLSSLFTPSLTAAFGWSRGDIATAAGIGLFGALLVPLIGRQADRFGPRPVIVAATLVLSGGLCGIAATNGALWTYQLLVFVAALSIAGTSSVVYGRIIAPRFVRHRGIALGVATSGISITTLVFSPVIAAVIASHGWRAGFLALAGLAAFVGLPLVLLLLRGAATHQPERVPVPDNNMPEIVVGGMSGAEARRDPRFWRLGGAAALINVASVGLVTQLVPFGIDNGLRLDEAALLVTSFGAAQIVGRLAMGLLVDRFPAQRTAAAFAGVSAMAFAALLMPIPGTGALVASVFFAMLMYGAENDLLPYLTARLFGLRAYGETYGTLLTMALFGTAGGIVMFGRLHDSTGDYTIALCVAAGAMGSAALLFLTLTDRPTHGRGRAGYGDAAAGIKPTTAS